MSHVTHVNESCHACEWVMSRMWMSHVTHVNESCHACEWVMSCMWMSHVTHVNESCHACEWVMSRMWMRDESIHTCEWVMSHTWMNRAWVLIHPQTWQMNDFKCVTCLTGVTHSNEWHDSFAFVTWFIHICNTIHSHEWHDLQQERLVYVYVRMDTWWNLCAYRYLALIFENIKGPDMYW